MRFCFHSSVEFSCIRSLHQAIDELSCRFYGVILVALLDTLGPGHQRCKICGLGLHLKCPTSRIPGSGALSGFLRSHASSNGVAGSASGCWDSPSPSALVVLPTSTPATDDRCSSCGLSEDAAGAVLALTGGCSSYSSCSPASTSLRMRRRPEMSTKPCCCPAALNHAQRYDYPAPCEPKSLTRSPVALFLLPLPLGPLM